MEKINTPNGVQYKVNGEKGSYQFIYKKIYAIVGNSAFKFPERITVYIFFNENIDGKPILIDIDYTKEYIILFEKVPHFEKIKKHKAQNFLSLPAHDLEEGRLIVNDIIAGSDFDMGVFNFD